MRVSTWVLAAGALLSSGAAQATTIRESLSGVIAGASTADTHGVFGPAGADLAGKAFTLQLRYNTADFNQSESCRTHVCTYYTSSGTALVPQAVRISLTIAGTTRTYQPSFIANVFVSTAGPAFFRIESDQFSGYGGYGPHGISVSFLTAGNPKFGFPISPRTPPVEQQISGYDALRFTNNSSELPIETLTFEVQHAAR